MGGQHSLYLTAFKITYISLQTFILGLFWSYNNSGGTNAGGAYEQHRDTTNVWAILIPTFVCAYFMADHEGGIVNICWTWSEFLEGFVMVPQYVFVYRGSTKDSSITKRKIAGQGIVNLWVCCIGVYRGLYLCNWMYRSTKPGAAVEFASWCSGGLQMLFFVDFCFFVGTGFSCLRTLVLFADDKVNDAGDSLELRVFPGRVNEVEQKKLRRRNLTEDNPYQQINSVIEGEPSMLGRPEFEDIL